MPKVVEVVFWSSKTGNTKSFCNKLKELGGENVQIIELNKDGLTWKIDFNNVVIVTPCYADSLGNHSVPAPIIKFLNKNKHQHNKIKGVVGTGNRSFGQWFTNSADVIASKMNIPVLGRVELKGTLEEAKEVIDAFYANGVL